MILDSPFISGSMSFGIANPSATMHISASTGAVLRVDGAGVTNTGSLFVSSSGNVGIGTTIPVSKLQIEGGALRIGDGAGGWSGFTFSGGLRQTNNNPLTILGELRVDSTAGNPSYISGSGGLGIGKTTANTRLDVNGNTLISGSINATGPITGSSFTTTGTITAQTLIVQTISSSLEFVTGSTKFGSLAANTHQFTGSLFVTGALSGTSATFSNGIFTDGSQGLSVRAYTGGAGFGAIYSTGVTAGAGNFALAASSTQTILSGVDSVNLAINSAIKLAISSSGAATFANDLTVGSPTANATLNISGDNSGGDTFLNFRADLGGIKAQIQGTKFAGTGGILYFKTLQSSVLTTAMVINQVGNVGIGTTSPSYRLDVRSDSTTNVLASAFSNTSSASNSTKSVSISLNLTDTGNSNKEVAILRAFTDGVNVLTGGLAFDVRKSDTTPSEAMRITSGNDILIAGGNTSGQSAVSTCTALRFPNQYSSGYTDAGVKLFIFNSGATIQGFTAGPAYDLQYHSSGDNTNGKHAWYVGNVQVMRVQSTSGNVTILGSLSKGSGSFRIKHPLASKKNTHQLVHSFIEGPQADLIYSGGVTLVNGKAIINIDEAATMTEGTFEALCRNIRVFTSNETSWDAVRGKVEGNILTIECQNTESTDEVSWLVIGERQDEHMFDTEWTDENGKVIVEPLIPADPGNLMSNNH
jgi:hypothetical protein